MYATANTVASCSNESTLCVTVSFVRTLSIVGYYCVEGNGLENVPGFVLRLG